jgi:hypothetical protein
VAGFPFLDTGARLARGPSKPELKSLCTEEAYMETGQNYGNHARLVPMYHFVTLGVCLLVVIGSVVNLVMAFNADSGVFVAILILGISLALLSSALFGRVFAIKVQDRVIRMEENYRHHLRTGKLLDPKLTMRQIIGLRFASDEEYDALALRAVAEGLSEKAIKQAIQNWRGDYVRA